MKNQRHKSQLTNIQRTCGAIRKEIALLKSYLQFHIRCHSAQSNHKLDELSERLLRQSEEERRLTAELMSLLRDGRL